MKTVSITSILLSSYAVFNPAYAADDSDEPLAFDKKDTAVVIIDPQNDFLSTNGLLWGKRMCTQLMLWDCLFILYENV